MAIARTVTTPARRALVLAATLVVGFLGWQPLSAPGSHPSPER